MTEESSETEALYQLVYSKSRVTLHPSPYSRDNIAGYLCLLRRPAQEASTSTQPPRLDTLLSWLPETLISSRSETAKFVDVELREAEGALERGEGQASYEGQAPTQTIHTKDLVDEESILIQPPLVGRHAYAFSHTLQDIYSLQLVKPSISNWHGSLTVAPKGGQTLPPLYFHDDESRRTILGMIKAAKDVATNGSASTDSDTTSYPPPQHQPPPTWGGDELIQHLRKYAVVHRSVHDHGVFLINPSASDLEMHSTPVFADDALDAKSQPDNSPTFPDDPFAPTYPVRMGSRKGDSATPPDSLSAWAKQTRMSLLSSFSQVTRSARQTSRQILSHPAGQPYTSRLPAAVQSFAHAGPLGPFAPVTPDEDPGRISQRAGVAEYDSARVYLAKWARLVAEEGERNKRREEQARGGTSTPQQEHGRLGVFEVLQLGDNGGNESHSPPTTSRAYDPIHLTEWQAWCDEEGKPTIAISELKRIVWTRGLAPSTRYYAWPYLLDVLDSSVNPDSFWTDKAQQYEALRSLCNPETSPINDRPDIVEQRHRIRVDCLRVDRKLPLFCDQVTQEQDENSHTSRLAEILLSYTLYDSYVGPIINDTSTIQDLLHSPTHIQSKLITDSDLGGYVQGMSDLCAPIYSIMDGDPVRTLVTFTSLMHRVRLNFHSNQRGMKTQLVQLQTLLQLVDTPLFTHLESTDSLNLFFCFRWLLVRFKREFNYEDVCRLWECGFALEGTGDESTRTGSLHIFVALRILLQHRSQTIAYLSCFDEVLQYFQGLGGTLDVEECLRGAERVVRAVRAWLDRRDDEGEHEEDEVARTVRELLGEEVQHGGGSNVHQDA